VVTQNRNNYVRVWIDDDIYLSRILPILSLIRSGNRIRTFLNVRDLSTKLIVASKLESLLSIPGS
jgi:hypothetical protein